MRRADVHKGLEWAGSPRIGCTKDQQPRPRADRTTDQHYRSERAIFNQHTRAINTPTQIIVELLTLQIVQIGYK